MNITGLSEDASGREKVDMTVAWVRLLHRVEHIVVEHVAALDRLGMAAKGGRSLRELLSAMGVAPAVISRWLRIARALDRHPRVMRDAVDGSISSEHVDALVRGVAHIEQRAPGGLSPEERDRVEIDLLAQLTSGATPAEVAVRARALGNEFAADDPAGVPAAEDRTISEVSMTVTADGRLDVRADLDVVIAEKLRTAIEAYSVPRPEPDGSPDARSAGRRQADALEVILDRAASAPDLMAAPRVQVMVTVPADHPDGSSLAWMGPITADTATEVACDGAATPVIVDGQSVPLVMGTAKRLFPAHLRKALMLRDRGCVKCGAPPSRCQAHHILPWSQGGTTDLNNGCLLCQSCHTEIHHGRWEIEIRHDGHPWLIPPRAVDAGRRPRRSYHRRTLTVDETVLAA